MKSITIFKRHWLSLLIVSILDFLFVITATQFHIVIFARTSALFDIINEELQKTTADFVSAPSLANLQYSTELLAAYHELIKYAFLLFFSLFVIFTLFESINFYIIRNKIKKTKFLKYVLKFTLINIFWFFLFLLIIVGSVALSTTTYSPLPLFNNTTVLYLSFLLIYILSYFAVTSYAIIPNRHPIRNSIKNIKQQAPIYLFLSSILLLLSLGISRSVNIAFGLFFAYMLLIFFPAFYFARFIYLKKVLKSHQ